MEIKPVKISKPEPYLLFIKWLDGFESTISLEDLRKDCPCANCTGESIGDRIYSFPKPVVYEPGVYDLVELKPVGNYALAATWGNGHNTGMYSWVKLREICNKRNIASKEIMDELKAKHQKDAKKIQLNVM